MEDLNQQQLQAVHASDGPLLIIAGPGTGKTKTLAARIAHLINQNLARPEQILALTFTKKAAEEMRERVSSLITNAPYIATFHALCHDLLAQHGQEMTFITETERLTLIKELPRPVSLKHLSTRELALLVSKVKNGTEQDEVATSFTQNYTKAMAEHEWHDFDDLLLNTRDLLVSDQTFAKQVRARFTYILVDEFQDTNQLQYELLQLIRGNDNLFVIGDPHQSIYGFRGASGDIFAQFRHDSPNITQITLTTNYRSASNIVRLSNAIFTDSPPLMAHQTIPGNVQAVEVLNEYSEANWVLSHIQSAIGGSDLLQASSTTDTSTSYTFKDFAILYRSRSAALALTRSLEQSGLPYQIVGEGSPYEQPDTLAAIAVLKMLAGAEAVAPLKKLSVNQVKAHLEAIDLDQPPSKLVDAITQQFNLKHTTQLANNLVRFSTLEEAVSYLDDISEQQFYDPAADAITLLTIHAAKGLEFSHVFLIGANQGVLPHDKAENNEELRLFYVAITRAKQQLDIIYSKKRNGKPAHISPFVANLPDTVLAKNVDVNLEADQRRARKRQIKQSQQTLF